MIPYNPGITAGIIAAISGHHDHGPLAPDVFVFLGTALLYVTSATLCLVYDAPEWLTAGLLLGPPAILGVMLILAGVL